MAREGLSMNPRRPLLVIFFSLLMVLTAATLACDSSDDDDEANGSPPAGINPPDHPGDDAADDDDQSGDDDDTIPPEPFDPMAPGPYTVGNRTLVLVDHERWDVWMGDWRTLLVEVWYPAESWARQLPRNRVRHFLGDWDEFVIGILRLMGIPDEELANLDQETGSARNPAVRADHAPYPLLLFSHGNAAVRFQNYTMCEYLASHGYIVVAPDHVENAAFVTYPDSVAIWNPLWTPIAFLDRQFDISFLVDAFEELNADDPDGYFTGMVDLERAGVIGHSFGGNTAQEVIKWDERFLAGAAFAGPQIPFVGEAEQPLLTMIGLEDHTMHDWEFLIRFNYLARSAPKLMLEFINGGHYTFTDACLLLPTLFGEEDGCGSNTRFDTGEPFDYIEHDRAFGVINPYLTAFFGAYLKDQPRMFRTLKEDLEPDEVVYNREWE
jgi:dienelactone hydrolase